MSDTIDLLETIGQSAALRHATTDELIDTLDQAGASEGFRTAVESGDISRLSAELGRTPMEVDHTTQTPAHEEEEPEGDDDAPLPTEPERSDL